MLKLNQAGFSAHFLDLEVIWMQIVGIRPSNFTGGDGTQVSGQNIYLVYPLEKGEGHGSERVFVTNAKA